MGFKPRKGSDATANDSDSGLQPGNQSGSQTPNGISPISPVGGPSPSPISPSRSRDNLKTDSPDSYIDFSNSYKHTHSQSATSLASGFTDITAPSSFSGGPQSPNSPFYQTEQNQNGSPFMSPSRMTSASNTHRPRSQTFPMLGIETAFGTPTGSGENLTPKQVQEIMSAPVLDTPIDEYPGARSLSISSSELHHLSSQPASSVHSPIGNNSPAVMAPPPIPAPMNTSTLPSPVSAPSQDEARRALELVMNFFQSQPSGVVDPQEYITMGKLMEKLKVQGSIGELPGGMHSIGVGQQKEMSRKRSIHSL